MSFGLSDQTDRLDNQERSYVKNFFMVSPRPINKYEMRVKSAYDWFLTWSPAEDVTKENIPEYILEFMHSENVTRCCAVLEYSNKWHLHIGFSLRTPYTSDYKWWKDGFKEHGLEGDALQIKYHSDIICLIGGYCHKDENRQVLFIRNFSEEQIEYGKEKYIKRQRRQRIRKTIDDHISIPREKFEVALGAYMAEAGCNRSEAIVGLARDGFAFASSENGLATIYQRLIANERRLYAPST